MNSQELLDAWDKLTQYDLSAPARIEELLEESDSPTDAAENLIESFVDERDIDPTAAVGFLTYVKHAIGAQEFESWVVDYWHCCPKTSRFFLAYAAADSAVLGSSLVKTLFDDSRDVQLRHRLAAGLAQSRTDPAVLFDLIDHIGTYEDSSRQSILEQFKASVQRMRVG